MKLPERFFSCDWGTSTFRLKLVESTATTIMEEESTGEGISNTFQLWKQSGQAEKHRVNFYLSVIKNHIASIEKKTGIFLEKVPVVISGMASSNIGMMEIPYKQIPFLTGGSDLEVKTIEANDFFNHPSIIISGVRSEDDVMRGEETKVVGCSDELKSEEFFILPGTHPKHIEVKNGKVIAFETYMTGEFFKLLSEKSILSNSVEEINYQNNKELHQSFRHGVINSKNANLLHSSFLVRTNHLFNKYSKQQNYFYLSGLLIGTELDTCRNKKFSRVTIVSNLKLKPFYEAALQIMLNEKHGLSIEAKDADEALVAGQQKILEHFIFNRK